MEIKRILLTGDDGCDSAGIRLLIRSLREHYDLTIAATKDQQSAVGGKLSLAHGFSWEEITIDDIPTLCVDGSPTDATELAALYFKEPFDLVISGINWGANLGSSVYSSGTYNAAVSAVRLGVAPRAIVMSWDLPREFYNQKHSVEHSIEEYWEYPGKITKKLLDLCLENKLWDAQLLNINFPQQPTTEVQMTRTMNDVQQIYNKKETALNREGKVFKYESQRIYNPELSSEFDVHSITTGKISITPCTIDVTDQARFAELKNIPLSLA